MVHTLVLSDEVAPEISAATLQDLAPELVLTAGDLPRDHVEWVADTVDCPVVYVPGNHDTDGPRNVIDADRQVVEAVGLRIVGLGGCVRYRPGPHQYSQKEFAKDAARLVRTARAAGPVDVLLTHAPPHGLGDGDDDAHIGIEALHDVLAELEPTWHLHGHIHPFGRPMPDRHVGRTTVRNVIPWRVVEIETRTSARTMSP